MLGIAYLQRPISYFQDQLGALLMLLALGIRIISDTRRDTVSSMNGADRSEKSSETCIALNLTKFVYHEVVQKEADKFNRVFISGSPIWAKAICTSALFFLTTLSRCSPGQLHKNQTYDAGESPCHFSE